MPYTKTATQIYLLRRQSRKTLYLDGGRLLLATTNLRFLCRPHFFDFGSVAAVDRKLFRSADAWDEFSFAGSPRGEAGGEGELREQQLRAESAQVVRSIALGRRPTRGGES